MISHAPAESKTIRKTRRAKKTKKRETVTRPRLDPARIYTRAEAALTCGTSEITLIRARDAGFLDELRAGYRVLHSGQQLISWLLAGGKTGYGKQR